MTDWGSASQIIFLVFNKVRRDKLHGVTDSRHQKQQRVTSEKISKAILYKWTLFMLDEVNEGEDSIIKVDGFRRINSRHITSGRVAGAAVKV